MSRLELIATAAFGLESVVSRELTQLGYHEQRVEDGRVTFVGDELAICRCNFWLRSADRVLVKVGAFAAYDFEALFQQVMALTWANWLSTDAKFPVSGKSVRSKLHAEPSIQGVTKKAIVESLKATYQRHWFNEDGPEYPLEVAILKDWVTISIDTSGAGLHKRGYRAEAGAAPLRETTAAALVLLSYWNSDRPFIDPFCGSGTIPIEAAMIARNRAPGANRGFQCEQWPQITREHWKQARDEVRDGLRSKPKFTLQASDIDPRVLRIADKNATEAGVGSDIEFKKMDVLELKTTREYGCIITNPPYGVRLEDDESAGEIYDDMADAFEPLSTWSIYVLTSHPGFERFFRRRADRRRKLYNGRLECHYFQYLGPRPPGETPAPEIPEESVTDADPMTEQAVEQVSVRHPSVAVPAAVPEPPPVPVVQPVRGFVDLVGLEIPRDILDLIPESVARENTVIPVALVDNRLRVAMPNHLDLELIKKLRLLVMRNIDSVPASKGSILTAIDNYYGRSKNSETDAT